MSVEQVGLKQKWDNLSQGKKTAIIAGGAVGAAAIGTTIAAGIKGGSMAKAIKEGAEGSDKFINRFKENTNYEKVGLGNKISAGYKAFFEGIKGGFNKIFKKNEETPAPKETPAPETAPVPEVTPETVA